MSARNLLTLFALFVSAGASAQELDAECVEIAPPRPPAVLRPLEREPGACRRVGGSAPTAHTDPVVEAFSAAVATTVAPRLQRCYERSLQRDPVLDAIYVFEATLAPTGVVNVRVVGKQFTPWHRAHGDLSTCLVSAVEAAEPEVLPRCGTVVIRSKVIFVRPD